MLCLIINKMNQCNIVQGVPDVLINDSDFAKVLRNDEFRRELFSALTEMPEFDTDTILIGTIGVEENGIFVDHTVKDTKPILFNRERELGVYEKL